MVFESVVVDVLNRFLGDYVVNLDSSQLSLGIWGGDAILRNLAIKENALSQLDIPFKVRAGHIGRLELKIPWKNLYTQSVEATLDEVFLLIVPTASIKYDSEKEERQLQEAQQRELQRIEETKQKAAEKGNPKAEKQDTFVEKLVTQVIKNLQVKISNIHVRYEDDVTNPDAPLSFGVSLQNLSLQTADQNWMPCLLDEQAKLFFKLVRLDNLFAYWNVNSELYSNHNPEEHSVAIQSAIPQEYNFIFRPISANAKLRMNPRSDVDFSSPKVDLVVNLPEVAVELSRPQYVSILELLGSVDMMTRNLPYRKYRPDVAVHTNAWRYVITGVLEVNVKPRLHMWSWQRIRHHRQHVKKYRELYKNKITSKKPAESLLKELEETERTLDIFNITMARQQAEMEASKAGLRIYRPGVKVEEEQSEGWFGWMWSWSGESGTQTKDVKTGGFDELMSPAEKAKLYAAIGYSETAVNPNLPKNFENMKILFQLNHLSLSIKESPEKPEIIKLSVIDLKAMLTQRPAAQAIKISAQLSSFEVSGLPRGKSAPILLSPRHVLGMNDTALLDLMFETNPLDASADQRLRIESQALEIIYDAMTVNSMSDFFMPPKDLQLDELTNATLMKLEQFRDKTSTGLMYIIETQKVLDLKINLMASYVIVPENGFYDPKHNLAILDLGHFQSRSDLPQLSVGSSTIEDIMSRAYDSFDIQLNSLQFLYTKAGAQARPLRQSAFHILEPVDLKVVFISLSGLHVIELLCMYGELPLLSLCISDDKVRGVLALLTSIPLPESRPAPQTRGPQVTPKSSKRGNTPQLTPRRPAVDDLRASIIYGSDEELFFDAPSSPIEDLPFFEASVDSLQGSASDKRLSLVLRDPKKNMTEFLLRFEINKLSIQLCRLSGREEVSVLHLFIDGLGTDLKLRTFDMSSYTFLREICLECSEYLDSEDKKVHLITTLDNTEEDLLTLEYVKADKNAPDFKTMYKNTEQLIKVNFSSLDVHMHTEALLNSINFLNNLLPPLKKEAQEEQPVLAKEEKEEEEEAKIEDSSKFEDVVNLHIRADLSCLKVFIRGEKARISEISIEGLVSEVQMKKKCVEILANLKNIVILDCDKEALYKKAVSIAGKEVFDFRMVNHVAATEGDAYTDMHIVDTSVTLTVGCIQVIFLNKFMSSILAFINNFQEAKNALAEVTAQAAEKAASGVLELAERSTRISLDVDIKAPVVFLPQSSVSNNVIVADLGLVTVKNHFEMVSSPAHNKIPPVMDIMAVGLSDLKMYRTTFTNGQFNSELQLLKPVNMDLSIKRNLSASWYHSIPDIQINAHLKPMSLILSQEDLTIVLKTLSENLSESSDAPSSSDKGDTVSIKDSQSSGGNTVVTAAVVEGQKTGKLKNTLKLDFKFDSMTIVLYSPNNEIQLSDSRDESLKLAEFMLGTISTAVHMFSDSSMKASLKLTNCLLDDKRQSVKMITSRMMAMRQGREGDVMVDMSYRKGRDGTVLDTLVQDLYLCASMEFLLTVANVFLKAMADGFSGPPKNKQPARVPAAPVAAKTEMNIVVKNPEIVFVADLTRADAPALIMTTQCELVMKNEPSGQSMTAAISDLKVVACPLLREKREHNVTTVLQPCQVFFQSSQSPSQPQSIELSISSLTLKVSPIIINTIITIQSALIPAAETPEELESPVPQDLWERRNLRDLKLWFLEEEEENVTRSVIRLVPNGESLKMNIDSICLTLEAGVGHRTVPMLLAKASFKGDVKNWSTLINLHCHLDLEVNYYNEMMGLWEPLLEPLDDEEKDCFRPWTLAMKMKKKPVSYSEISDEVDGSVPDYKTVISFTSKDQLNITLSKCGIYMLSNLGTQTAECFQKDQAPFVVKNRLGLPVAVLHSEVFRPIGKESKNRVVELQDGENLNMDYTHTAESSDQFSAMTSLSAKNYIQPTPVGHTSASVIPLIKTGRDMHSVMHHDSGVTRFFVCQIYTIEGSKYVKIRSPFQIINHFSVAFRVYEGSECLGISLPSEEFCVPLGSYRSVTAQDGEEQYDRSEGFAYTEVNQKPGECLVKTCHHHEDSARMLKVNMVPVPDTLMSHSTEEEYDKPIILHLWPTVLLRNLLPYPITFKIKGNGDFPSSLLKAGHSSQIHTAIMDFSTLELKLLGYLQQDWESKYSLCSDADEISFIRFCSLGEDEETEERPELNIAVHVKKEEGQLVVAIHSPYWMVNKTGRLLQYKADDVHHKHQKDYDMPLLFSFKPCNFLQNNKIRLMISESELSDDFSIDTVGSYGDVKCKGGQKDFMVKVLSLQPSDLNTSKLTLFSFLILYFLLSYWYTFSPKTVYRGNGPLFKKLTGEMYNILYEIYRNGICVFWLKESICLFIYFFSNLICLFPLKCVEMDELAPGQAVYYTWAEPTGSRILSWKWGKYKGELKSEELLDVNKEGKFFVVSFYEGLQRVALFTTEHCVFKKICDSEKMELAEQETCISLQNMGISLVNNSSSHEVAFVGITSSDVVWETKPKKRSRWKVLSVKETAMLEQRYREYMESGPTDGHSCFNPSLAVLNVHQVLFAANGVDMRIMQPFDAPLRRNFLPALKVEYSVSARQKTYRVQINRIQIQNQLPGAIFPFVFYPVKPPKSVSMDSEPKPLADVSIITRVAGHSDILRIKYFKVLIQEMDLRIDLGFLYALLELLTAEHASAVTSEQQVELFEKDIEYLKTELNHSSATDTSPISLYEYFHISPIKLHLSFSLSSGGEDGNKIERETGVILVQSLNLLLKSIGATLTDAQDVLFKLAFCELRYQFRTTQQLQSEVVRHYSKQAIKQMYVLVLGLDVLGNPFGLIRGLSQGVEAFFYEPYQGAIQGPEEFVEGMALGVKALVGGAVGGLAGAASRITGAMAKGVAAMTMDEEYQQKRREAMNKQPSGLREGLSRGGKGLVSGFVSGITGIVTKPIKGAQKEGAAGFFKGMGKGLVGVLTRPTGGIIDMASSTFQGIRRAAETSQNVESLRPPRFIHEDGVIRPYKEREGIGSQMLQNIENGRFAKYRYFAHAKVNESDFLMITKRGIFFVTQGTFGQLTCEWQYLFDEFIKTPAVVEGRRLRIEAKERVKSVFHAKEFGKIINFKTPELAKVQLQTVLNK
uniref:Vacuolar protein sorting 13 homolog A n=1 Tax=Cyprinus carpio TaxID=7962 RepID=A0A8C2BZ69_CYPCA